MGRLYSLVRSMVIGGVAMALTACTGTSVIGGGDSGGESGGSAGATGGGDASSCGLTTPAELATTPRANEEAEWLAMEATDAFIASSDVYDRVVQDLGIIRGTFPEVASIKARSNFDPGQILLLLDETGMAAAMANSYTDWNCLNEFLGVTAIDLDDHPPLMINTALLHFNRGRFNMPMIYEEYMKLPHIMSAEPNLIPADGNDVCVSIDGDVYSYIFDIGTGDCLLGCTEHTYFGYAVPPDDGIQSLGTFTLNSSNPPEWFSSRGACTKWL